MEMYLKLQNIVKNYIWIKRFNSEYEMDKFLRKLKFVKEVIVLEDSREIYYPDYNK